ncbi:MAG: alkaline phosphatase family protein [Polyangia bacterium]|jgi:hypothetical protein
MRTLALCLLSFAVGCSSAPPGNNNGSPDLGGVGGGGQGDAGNIVNGQDGSISNGTDGSMPADLGGKMGQTGIQTIFTIVLENTSYSSVVGNTANAPYLNKLIKQYGLATNYKDSGSHPSLPNYLYMVSGDTQYFGLFDVSPTTSPFPKDADNLGNQLTQAKVPWRAYLESMGTPCNIGGTSPYAAKHNPFVYFKDMQGTAVCNQADVDYSNFAADLAAGTYRFMWISPNLNDDGHDTNLQTADTWCSQEIPKILASQAFKNNGVLFVTWDEGDASLSDQVPMIVVSPLTKAGFQSSVAYTHASYLATVEDTFHLPRLGAAAQAQAMTDFFQ